MTTELKTFYWSRSPGRFVNKSTGVQYIQPEGNKISFTGTIREWYETLSETILDAFNSIDNGDYMRRTIYVPRDIATMLEATVLYKPHISFSGKSSIRSPGIIGVLLMSIDFVAYRDKQSNVIHLVSEKDYNESTECLVEVLDMEVL